MSCSSNLSVAITPVSKSQKFCHALQRISSSCLTCVKLYLKPDFRSKTCIVVREFKSEIESTSILTPNVNGKRFALVQKGATWEIKMLQPWA